MRVRFSDSEQWSSPVKPPRSQHYVRPHDAGTRVYVAISIVAASARDRLALSPRRWPSGKPRSCAFCRSAPAVRFMALAIFLTGDLLRECALSSRTSSLDQGRRLLRSFGCHQIPPADDALGIFRSLNELVDSNLC